MSYNKSITERKPLKEINIMSDAKTGRGNFTPREFKFTGVDGKEYSWVGRGRYSKELAIALESEQSKGLSTLAEALAAHKKNKPTGNPVGRPKGTTGKSAIKQMVAETVAKAD
jgi:hypothetical protein